MSREVGGIVFDAIWLLPLAIALPILAVVVLRHAFRKRRERLERLGTLDVVARLIPVSALASPRWRMARLGVASALVASRCLVHAGGTNAASFGRGGSTWPFHWMPRSP
jgi:hypothetical protein